MKAPSSARLASLRALAAARAREAKSRPGRRRPDLGGEPAPVSPEPKPMPLTGGAAAPVD